MSALGLLDFSIISLYQVGVIQHLPDLPGDVFDSDYVNGSDEAYQFGAPDAPISAIVYALNMTLATAGGTEKTGRPPPSRSAARSLSDSQRREGGQLFSEHGYPAEESMSVLRSGSGYQLCLPGRSVA